MIPIAAIIARHNALTEQLTDATIDHTTRPALQRELRHLSYLIDTYRAVESIQQELDETTQARESESDAEMQALYDTEAERLRAQHAQALRELEECMVPPSEHDDRSVFLEIRAGAGGQEAALFAGDLLKMYTNYALSKGWRAEIESSSATDLGGYREVVLYIKGKNVYGSLKRESGVHRVQRVPSTETSGRVHTSTATIAVLPEAKEVDVSINPADLRIDVYRASGAGGQHVNTTDSAVRITHEPTGVVVSCQDERSQHKNKAKAMKMLQSRLLMAHMEKEQQKASQQRKELVGTGMRAEKVRTYNFPQNRVTDHQVNLTLKKLDMVMEGDLQEIIDALAHDEQAVRRATFLSQFIQ